ncbi:MAG TPA: DinB family protein [Gemmatimonadaceae bacterium]|nr:DinB family protein [Gemmatimonadaceae bacterium]
MTIAELRDLFEYNRWAHEKTLDAAAILGPGKFAETPSGSDLSLRSVLQKLLAEEVIWLSRWEGHSLAEIPDYSECADTAALLDRWTYLWKRQARFLESVLEDELGNPINIRLRTGIETVQPLGETLTHVVNQATYLRGEAAVLIRQLGGTAPKVDLFTYRLENGSNATIAP